MAVYAIGDIQGCYDEFVALLDRLQFNAETDQLWLTGDLVNRGPRSLEVLRLVKSLGNAAVTVLGNHDLHLLAQANDPKAQLKKLDTLDAILAAKDRDELLHWLQQQPLLHHDTRLQFTLIHAGLPPQWDLPLAMQCATEVQQVLRNAHAARELFANMYGDEPDQWRDDLKGMARLRFITNCLTRLRVCHTNGRLKLKYKGPAQALPDDLYPWFRAPNRQSARERIIFGHWSALGYHDADNVLGLDTGCVWGGKLCAVRLDDRAASAGAHYQPVFVDSFSAGLPVEE